VSQTVHHESSAVALQPADPNWHGKRFLSPDGSSWLAVYSFPVASESIAKHMQSVTFAEGETLTYMQGQREFFIARPPSPATASLMGIPP
jgi:hypothetical protein